MDEIEWLQWQIFLRDIKQALIDAYMVILEEPNIDDILDDLGLEVKE